MAFKAINNIAGPNGLILTLLVFGAYPRMVEYDVLSVGMVKRAETIKMAIDEVREQRAKRQVTDALRERNGPNVIDVMNLPLNSKVMVFRERPGKKSGHQTRPYTLLRVDKTTYTVEVNSRSVNFLIIKLRVFHEDLYDNKTDNEHTNKETSNRDQETLDKESYSKGNSNQQDVLTTTKTHPQRVHNLPKRYRPVLIVDDLEIFIITRGKP